MYIALAGLVAALCLIVVLGAPYIERALMYQPSGGRISPQAIGLNGVKEVVMTLPDGARIISWFAPARAENKTILYFHGNGASLAARSERIAGFVSRGFGVFMMSYRGYSGSTGVPSEAANVADAMRAYDTLVNEGTPPDQIVLYGESLGTGVAVQIAAAKPVAGLILDAPYTSIVDVARLCYPHLPASLFMRDRYETMKYVARVDVPALVIHGERDDIIPVEMGRHVAASLNGDAKLVTFQHAGHTDHFEYGSMDAITGWLDALPEGTRKRTAGSAA